LLVRSRSFSAAEFLLLFAGALLRARSRCSLTLSSTRKDHAMTQAELDRAVASSTGELLSTIRCRGFSIVEIPDLEPLTVDWDELDAARVAILPDYRRPRQLAAA